MSRKARRTGSLFTSLNPFSRVDRALEWKRSRRLRVEVLEDRRMLTTTLFLDFGLGFGTNGLDMTVQQLRDIAGAPVSATRTTGPDLSEVDTNPLALTDILNFRRTSSFDLDFDGDEDEVDVQLFATQVIDVVARVFEPFNINIVQAAATTIADVATTLAINGNGVGNRDAYVFVTDVFFNSASVGNRLELSGIAATVDLRAGGGVGDRPDNSTDEVAILFMENITNVLRAGYVIAHEAGHTFGLSHTQDQTTEEGGVNEGVATDEQLLLSGDQISAGPGRNTFENNFWTRFDLDLQTPGVGRVNNYIELATDPNIGLRDNNNNGRPDIAFVTGTGAHDRVSAVAVGGSVQVTIDAFNDASRTTVIRSEAYAINLNTETDGPILIDAGLNDDLIEVDLAIAGSYRIRGGAGTDRLVADAMNQTVVIGANGTISIAGVQLEVSEIEEFEIFNAAAFEIEGTNGDDEIIVENNGGSVLVTVNGDVVLNGPIDSELLIRGLAGNDTLIVDSSAGLVAIADGIRFDGGTGQDRLELRQLGGTTRTSSRVNIGSLPGQGQSVIVDGAVTQTVFFENIEPVLDNVPALSFAVSSVPGLASLLQASNDITYTPGEVLGPTAGRVTVDQFEPIEFENKTELRIDAGSGDDTIVVNNPNIPTGLTTLTINGDAGHDEIRLEALPDAATTTYDTTLISGGSGNDTIDGSAIGAGTPLIIDGNAGHDMITGGAGNDVIQAGLGDDLIFDSPGDDIISGGEGEDQYLIRGNSLNNVISVTQNAPSAVAADLYTLAIVHLGLSSTKSFDKTSALAPADPNNRPDIERIVIEGLAGNDLITITQADEYSDLDPNNGQSFHTIPFTVDGGTTGNDRLLVNDAGFGDLVIQRVSSDAREGSFEVGGMATIEYTGIEFPLVGPQNPITGGTGTDGAGRLVVFQFDPFEINDTLPTATFLGAGPTVNASPTVDPAGFAGFPGDNDFYQFVAQETGTLDLQLYFEPIGTLANGRPGLYNNGELLVTAYDSDGLPIAIGTATDLLDPAGNKVGERITLPVVRNNTYYLRVQGEELDGITAVNVYNFTGITIAAPIPELVDLQSASDSGRHNGDNITRITTPTFDIILDDDRIDEFMNIDLIPDTVDDDAQTLNNAVGMQIDYGVEVFNNGVSIGFAFYTGLGNTWRFTATAGDLTEGDFNHISAAVWIRDRADPAVVGRHLLSDSLQVTLDTITPPVSFGLPDAQSTTDGLVQSSDSGVTVLPALYADRVTSDTTPSFWGIAEADTVVRLFLDINNNGIIDLGTDILLGQAVANPEDGNLAYPEGYWQITSAIDLNQLAPMPKDGVRRLLVTAEDVAGNPQPVAGQIADGIDELLIFLDTQGPQITDVTVDGFPGYDLFDPKPSINGFTPLVDALTIHIRDLPNRLDRVGVDNDFLYEALIKSIAENPGNYRLVGDHVGNIAIENIIWTPVAAINGQPATGTITLNFVDPLPDDRFTLTILDSLVDPAGNNLDGETNAAQPVETPFFPSGDGVPGGNFVARFTVDSRPEIGTYIPTTISIDINGNFVWDPANAQIGNDFTNVDLTFNMQLEDAVTGSPVSGGFGVHDLVFAGQFFNPPAPGAAAIVRPFDQLAVFGALGQNTYRWLIDMNSDGVVNPGDGDILTFQPRFVNGFDTASAIPIAGDFDNDPTNGDEIGLYNAGRWALDTNRNFVIDPGDTFINSNLYGYPIVGDFNGDGLDDLAVHHAVDHQFRFDLNRNGTIDAVINWGFPGVLELPVAADMNQDGIDDIGLWVPRNSTQLPRAEAEWFFLISDDSSARGGFNVDNLDHAFKIVPFGTDLTAHFGDELARPIIGNFDPPVTATSDETPTPGIAFDLPGDFDKSGVVDKDDYELWKSQFGQSGTGLAADANQDGTVDISDFTIWRNHIGTTAADYAGAQIVAVPGDYNSDGLVDTDDYQVWKSQYGMTGNLSADGNQDGRVDLADFTFWRNSLTVAAAEMSAGGVALAIEAPAPLPPATRLKAAVADEAHASDEAPLQLASTGFRPVGRSTLAGADPERVQATVDAALTQPDDDLLLYRAMPLETQRDETDLEDLFELAADEEFEANQEGLPLTLTTEGV